MYRNCDDRDDDDRRPVELSERDVRHLVRILLALTGSQFSQHSADNSDRVSGEVDRTLLIARAQRAFLNRQRRSDYFSKAMFGEPAWDMLLILYLTDAAGSRQTLRSLHEMSGSAQTTALRWLAYLEKEKLIERDPHPTDKRTAFIYLTDKGRGALDAYFAGLLSDEQAEAP